MSEPEKDEEEEEEGPPPMRVVYVGAPNQVLQAVDVWHRSRVRDMEEVKENAKTATVKYHDEPVFKLEGQLLHAFLIGIAVTEAHFGTLPFSHADYNSPDEDASDTRTLH